MNGSRLLLRLWPVAALCLFLSPLAAQTAPDLDAATRVALEMPRSIDYAEWDEFISVFAEDAVMFFPFMSARATSRDEIASVMRPIFEKNRARLPGPIFGFEPVDIVRAPLGENGAVVSWFMERDGNRQRRTAVLRLEEDEWKIVLVHADNWAPRGS